MAAEVAGPKTEATGARGPSFFMPIFASELSVVPGFRADAAYRRYFWALAVLGLLLYIPNAGSFGLWDPWETHYGEVTRSMIESHDFVNPWWGFKEKIGSEGQQGSPFFSKPVYLFWIEAVFIKLIGFSEWAIRLPVALIGWLAALSVFMVTARIRRHPGVGFLAGLAALTSPQFFFLGRQAQTDMPYVGTMTIALCFFVMAVFGPREALSRRGFGWRIAAVVGLIIASTLPQYGVIATDLQPDENAMLSLGEQLWKSGWAHAATYIVLLAAWVASTGWSMWRELRATAGASLADRDAVHDRWLRRSYLWVFYALAAHSTLAKGLLGFMLPGAIIFIFLLLTGGWRSLARMELVRGVFLFVAIAFPWYVAMFAGHGMAYYNRFFIHDHFNRLGAGVHQIDSGTFEHFLKWLAFGMFPWAAVAPFAAAQALRLRVRALDVDDAAKLFVFLWFFVSFALFTVSSTKFHHYIFPALPPLAILIGMELWELPDRDTSYRRLVAIVGATLVVAIAWNLRSDVQSLRNLFTYKYDRPLPEHLPTDVDAPIAADDSTVWGESLFYEDTNPFILNLLDTPWLDYETTMTFVAGLALLGLVLLAWRRSNRAGQLSMGIGSVVLTAYGLNVYMPMLSPHWSQKYLFEKYYADCTMLDMGPDLADSYRPWVTDIGLGAIADYFGADEKRVCKEDVVSWLITWRGETYYSNNEIRPITKEATQFETYLRDFNRGRTFYVLMERGKEKSWGRRLNTEYLKEKLKNDKAFSDIESFEVEKVFNENKYFILVRVTPKKKIKTSSTSELFHGIRT